MRRFTDLGGRGWEVITGRESWGSFVAIFVPLDGPEDLRQTPLQASGHEEASAEIERLDDRGLGELLERAVRKEMGE